MDELDRQIEEALEMLQKSSERDGKRALYWILYFGIIVALSLAWIILI